MDQLQCVSLKSSIYKDIEFYNLKMIHHINWFQLGWASKTTDTFKKMSAEDFKQLMRRIKSYFQQETIFQTQFVMLENEIGGTPRFQGVTTKKIYDAYTNFIHFMQNSKSDTLFKYTDLKQRIFQTAIEMCERYEKWTPNQEQKQALQMLCETSMLFIVGEGGTGKSSIVNCFIKSCMQYIDGIRIIILTPTGKAAIRMREILSRYEIGCSQVDVSTIHLFDKTCKKDKKEYDIVIVDETSMFGIEHQDILLRNITNAPRVVFMGDYHQLPSICGSDFLYQMKTALRDSLVELKTNERVSASNSELKGFLTRIRNTENYHYTNSNCYELSQTIPFSLKSSGNVVWMTYSEFIKHIHTIFGDKFVELSGQLRFHTQCLFHKNIGKYDNDLQTLFVSIRRHCMTHIRQQMGVSEKPFDIENMQMISVGDIVINTKNVYLKDTQIMNGTFGVVQEIRTYVIHSRLSVKVYKVQFEMSQSKSGHNVPQYFHNVVQKRLSRENTERFKQQLREYCVTLLDDYYTWFEKSLVTVLQLPYITTVHKAQGSQWNEVVVFLESKKSNASMIADVDKQLFYTACSRAKEKLYIVCPDKISINKMKIRDEYNCPISQTDFLGALYLESTKNYYRRNTDTLENAN